MDTCNPDGFTSSMADDIFFVLQKCTRSEGKGVCHIIYYVTLSSGEVSIICTSTLFRRAFSSGNVDGACAVLNNARWVWLCGCGLP